MARKNTTPSFIVNRRIQVNKYQEMFLNDVFLTCGFLYNDVLTEIEHRAQILKNDSNYMTNRKIHIDAKKKINELEKSIKQIEKSLSEQNNKVVIKELKNNLKNLQTSMFEAKKIEQKACTILSAKNELVGFSEYGLHKFAGKLRREKYSGKLGANIIQKIASDAWHAEEKVFYGDGKKVHFRKYDTTVSFEDKTANSGIIYKPADDTRKKRKFEHVVILGHPMNLKSVRKKDTWLQKAMKHKIKFCRIVRRPHGNKYHYFLQIVMEGTSPVKHSIGKNTGGIDPGVSTMTYYTGENLEMVSLSPEIAKYQKKVKQTAVVYERRRRMANPQNYNEDGTIKKDTKEFHKEWYQTKGMIRSLMQLKTAYRKMREYVKQCNGYEANRILMQVSTLYKESMDYKGLAKRAKECKRQKCSSTVRTKQGKIKTVFKYKRRKRYGASILKHAPSEFLRILERKIHAQGGLVQEIDRWEYRASQYNHVSDSYEKYSLSTRTKIIGKSMVQRDCYSAFLLTHASTTKTIDRNACLNDFNNYLSCQKTLVSRLKSNGDPTGNFGLKEFFK